jgi:hypothetical protein
VSDINDDELFIALERYSSMVELMSGIRQQFIDAGWHPTHAEVATIELTLGRMTKK